MDLILKIAGNKRKAMMYEFQWMIHEKQQENFTDNLKRN